MSRTWEALAEAVGLKDATNWNNVNKRQNMARYGTMDRRNQQGPTPYFNSRGTGQAQRQATMAGMQPDMGRRTAMQIPFGTDRPTGQPNPLMTPTRRPSPLSTSPNSPRGTGAPPMGGEDEEDEGLY